MRPSARPSTRVLRPLLSGGTPFALRARLPVHGAAAAAAISPRPFSAQTARRSGEDKNKPDESINPQLPKVTFESLGVTGPLKWVIVGLLTVFGTIETWVWCKAIWRWWKGGEVEPSED
ncbi:hypothetical protein ACKVWC_008699 [Pyricularia oryzae]|nr:hypothetical protein MCOR30_007312 [Pyricularia oryzae]KAI6374346.1 hypothetical protein MCOR31_002833 [Pyricularia oryzae]KAI6421480.1 hypothetical protein MCOR24_004291 [Pyricularia oryzae]KAI6486610.1 hypothetical protein MCOR11_009209 [Pyricularia oryzae]KAI6522721.1 hypothetical protein MCOR10_005534 [Pyricularia oryzae]